MRERESTISNVVVRLCEHLLFPPFAEVREGWGTLFVACASEIKSHATSSDNALALFRNLAIIAQRFGRQLSEVRSDARSERATI